MNSHAGGEPEERPEDSPACRRISEHPLMQLSGNGGNDSHEGGQDKLVIRLEKGGMGQ